MLCKVNSFVVVFLVLLLGFIPDSLTAENKIPPRQHNWQTLATSRFLIHYPSGYLHSATIAAAIAEDTADKLQFTLRHNLTRRVPVFLYPAFQDFQSTNIVPYPLDEGTGGFTDFFERRVVLPVNGDLEFLRHVLSHEIVHAYQFDILQGRFGSYPLWLMEGMAEYLSQGTEGMDSVVRDLMVYSRMPDLFDLQFKPSGYMNYPGGQSVMHFIASGWGVDRIGVLLRKIAALRDIDLAFRSTFQMSFFEFGIAYRQFIEKQYAKAKTSNPESQAKSQSKEPQYGWQRVSFRYLDRSGFHFKPAISPDAKTVAFLTYQTIFPAIVIRPLPKPGISEEEQGERRLLLRFLRSADYEEWQPLSNRLSFHPDGRQLLFATRSSGKQSLVIVSTDDGRLLQRYTPPLDRISDPVFSKDGSMIAFVGSAMGRTDLFLLDVATSKVQPVTNDLCAESSPSFSKDSKAVYYSSCGNGDPIRPDFDLFKIDIETRQIQKLISLKGRQDMPVAGDDGSLLFLSDHEGVRNLYRLWPGSLTQSKVEPLTASNTDLLQVDATTDQGESVVFSRREEGAVEIYRIAAPAVDAAFYERYSHDTQKPKDRKLPTVDTGLIQSTQMQSEELKASPFSVPFSILSYGDEYSPLLKPTGYPFVFITGATDSKGNSAIAFLGYSAFQDLKGDHQLEAFLSYQESPVYFNGEAMYRYSKYRLEAGASAYSYSGVFAIFNPMDFSLNNIIYNPFYRLSSLQTSGIQGFLEMKFHSFGQFQLSVETGRDEFIYRPNYPEEDQRNDVYQNRQSIRLRYLYDSTVYSLYGPLDGVGFMLMTEMPVRASGRERELYQHLLEYRLYHLFENDSIFAFRALAVAATGRDAKDYPYRIGGYYTLRGYEFQEFEGRYAALVNLEYRFTLIERLIFGVPTSWSPGMIRSSVFMDAGAAFDDPATFQGVQHGQTRDLRASIGVGLHWANFLWFIMPGALMKIEWASPYDGRRSLPFSDWQGRFSVGIQF